MLKQSAVIIPMKPQSVNALVVQAKAAWDRADEKKADADDWYKRTGRLLKELKAQVKDQGGQWLPTLKKIGRSARRAQELMRLVDGTETIEHQRESTRKRVKKHATKKKSALANAHKRSQTATPPDEADEGQSLEERWQYSIANLCGDVVAIQSYWDKHFSGWKHFECPSHIKTLMREAATALASITKTVTSR
jgi:hypothetical protein